MSFARCRLDRLARQLRTGVFGFTLLVAAPGLFAAVCSLDVQGVNFGGYDFQNSQNLDSVGHVTVTCDVGTTYAITMSPGAGSYATRAMQSGIHQLAYNLYTDVTHSTVWGDGSGNSSTVDGSGTDMDFPVYGSVPAGQNPYVGAYSDVIVVSVTF